MYICLILTREFSCHLRPQFHVGPAGEAGVALMELPRRLAPNSWKLEEDSQQVQVGLRPGAAPSQQGGQQGGDNTHEHLQCLGPPQSFPP